MLGARYTGILYVDGQAFYNQLINGVADNSKKAVIKELHDMVINHLLPEWMAEHKVEYHITDRKTKETIII